LGLKGEVDNRWCWQSTNRNGGKRGENKIFRFKTEEEALGHVKIKIQSAGRWYSAKGNTLK
jgi:hypothetical protein